MSRQRHGLLLELIFVCGFFILASCIFVLVFFKAGQLSTLSRDTSAAVNAAQTIVEGIYPPEDENAAESREYTLSLYLIWMQTPASRRPGTTAWYTLKSPSIPATARRKSSTACPPTGISARRTPWKRDRIRHT